ncbi:helicase associated domain-containing protein [Streptomyces sp. NPDC012842]|uniref:helicase associated domain-containing protein n=1 Tax=Streptomyces TaxID=1883 RepID=UPI0033E31081
MTQPGLVRLAPLRDETNLSYLTRLADRYGLGVTDLVPALFQTGRDLFKGFRTDGEVYFNAEARARVSAFCRVPESVLGRALPAWTAQEPLSRGGAGPAGRFRFGAVVPAAGEGCRLCTAARTGGTQPARLYLQPHTRVCVRHQRWMLGTQWVDGTPAGTEQFDLAGLPEVVSAHQSHLGLLRQRPDAGLAFEVAHAVIVSWWAQQWPEEEQWPDRVGRVAPSGADAGWWWLLVRDAVIYPETVALARVLTGERVGQRLLAETGGRLPHMLAHTPGFLAQLARVVRRPWLPDRIASASVGPLVVWVQRCVRAGTGGGGRLWVLDAAHRPRSVARELAVYRGAVRRCGKAAGGMSPHLGVRHTSDQAFTAGLAHARAYAAVHGHLAAPVGARFDGFALGQWLSDHRESAVLPAEHVADLEALDPWWRPAWPVVWQQFYYQARDHTRARGALRPERGFPTAGFGLGQWLYQQCAGYESLHPAQQDLLADIGLTCETARAARPGKRRAVPFQRVLGGALAFAQAHGTLVNATTDTVQDGHRLGRWLAGQRSEDRAHQRRHGSPSPGALALSEIDPWWNPPWTLQWQRSWYEARACLQDGSVLDTADSKSATWLATQCARYDTLLPGQRDLLARIGITAAAALEATTRPAENEADYATALRHARSYHAVHHTLAAATSTIHDGFHLGQWLRRQRQHARDHARRGAPTTAAAKALSTLDPWWCPPWSLSWQRSWQRIHDQNETGGQPDTDRHSYAQRAWLRQQHTRYHDLHPDQQGLLTSIGFTTLSTARTRPVPGMWC